MKQDLREALDLGNRLAARLTANAGDAAVSTDENVRASAPMLYAVALFTVSILEAAQDHQDEITRKRQGGGDGA